MKLAYILTVGACFVTMAVTRPAPQTSSSSTNSTNLGNKFPNNPRIQPVTDAVFQTLQLDLQYALLAYCGK
jgi:hypothetical protein